MHPGTGAADEHEHEHEKMIEPVEFTVELKGQPVVTVPAEIAAELPKSGLARVIIVTRDDCHDAEWHRATCEQFVHDDAPEDAIYDTYK